jgi:acyl-CoA synthetase (AMP-forming)/AMP-acid ligase II
LFWSGGFVFGALASMAAGARMVLQERVDAASALELLETEGCTVMSGWHQARPLTEHPDFPRRRLRLRKGTGANHPLAATLLGPAHAAVTNYGMTETATCITSARWDDPEPIRVGTFGRPLGTAEVRIVDAETRGVLAAGQVGEIHVRGPTLMEGYHRIARADTFDAAGFFATGDLGYVDAAGRLHFTGRFKDVIKTAGVNVAAREVEEALAGHPAVRSAHVVGVPDAERGETVAAFVVARPGMAPGGDELEAFCRQRLASYKVPRHVFVVRDDELPVTGSGKVEKQALRRAAEGRIKAARES